MKLALLLIHYFCDFVVANLVLAKQLLSPRLEFEPQVIEIDTKVESPAEILALSNMITFTPGTLTLDVKPGDKISVHVLSDSAKAKESIRERLEEPLLEITRRNSK